jgi:hypothetical protein
MAAMTSTFAAAAVEALRGNSYATWIQGRPELWGMVVLGVGGGIACVDSLICSSRRTTWWKLRVGYSWR